ncbi:hypothetical protein TIFTF001_031902 [Ficus carica]|uniref:Uncharacterized protein n=1 Tax=Ficus carica TaxID=3494 RepID=A0AA88DVY0_FICCA|nr:hypothetical protein TIFTF001_031902 [Ficus carica]
MWLCQLHMRYNERHRLAPNKTNRLVSLDCKAEQNRSLKLPKFAAQSHGWPRRFNSLVTLVTLFARLQRLRWQGGEKRLPEQWWVGDGNSEENVLQSNDPIKKAPYEKGNGNEHLKGKLTKHGCQKFKDRTNKKVGKIPKSHADYQGR